MRILFFIALFLNIGLSNSHGQVQIVTLLADSGLSIRDIDYFNEDTVLFCSGSKIYRTVDGGISWDTIETNIPYIRNIDFLDFDNGIAISFQAIRKTSDAGLTWDSIQFLPFENTLACHIIDTGHFVVSTYSGYIRHIYSNYYIDDTLVDPLAIGYPVVIFDFDFLDANEGFGSGVVNGFSAVIHTSDNGLTWDVRANSGFLYLYMHEISFINSMVGGAIEQGPAMGEKIAFTSDGGYTWVSGYWPFFQDMRMNTLDFSPSGIGLVVGQSGYIYRTDNGGLNWDTIFKAVSATPYGLKIKIVNDSVAYMGGSGGIYKITNFATSINNININQNFSINPNPNNGIFTFQVPHPSTQAVTITIYNAHGKKIIEELITTGNLQFDLTPYGKGLYFIKILNGNKVTTEKVIVN